jgi:hypothetical protein
MTNDQNLDGIVTRLQPWRLTNQGSIPTRGKHIGTGKHRVHPRTGHEGPEGEYRYSSTISLTSALNGGVKATPRPLNTRESPGTHCTGGWVGPRVRLDGRGKPRPTVIRFPDRPACSESLCRLCYPGPLMRGKKLFFSQGADRLWEPTQPRIEFL